MIDARGLSCPLPVVMTQKEIQKNKPAALEVLVDNACAKENVSRFAANAGYSVEVKAEPDDEFLLTLTLAAKK